METRSDISVVLCRVKEAGNVGSICRGMLTMGFDRLVLADCPAYQEEKLRMMAVHAYGVYENAARFPSLDAALADFSLAAGFTRRRGAKRKGSPLSLGGFAARLREKPAANVALVFGNESEGLRDEELKLCSLAVYIPTSEAFPSLNVAQAVQIACYQLASLPRADEKPEPWPALRRDTEAAVAAIACALAAEGFFQKSDDSHLRFFLRDLCERAGASADEVDYLKKLFLKAAALSSLRS